MSFFDTQAKKHSLYFGNKNTWSDWHLIPTSRPVINPPIQKTNQIEIPGADGILDLSTSLTGYPLYNNREGELEFIVMNDYKPWQELYTEIMEYLSGKKMRMILEDDKDFYYDGYYSLKEWKSTHPWASVVISYSVNPYKWTVDKSYSLYPGYFDGVPISSSTSYSNISIPGKVFGIAPICPSFYVSADDGMDIRYVSPTLNVDIDEHLKNGTSSIPELIIYDGGNNSTHDILFRGKGSVDIIFEIGRL